jgi:hypothetical protein
MNHGVASTDYHHGFTEVKSLDFYPTAFQECYLLLRLTSSLTHPKTKPPLLFLGAAVFQSLLSVRALSAAPFRSIKLIIVFMPQ